LMHYLLFRSWARDIGLEPMEILVLYLAIGDAKSHTTGRNEKYLGIGLAARR
jgi:hypothetical protein